MSRLIAAGVLVTTLCATPVRAQGTDVPPEVVALVATGAVVYFLDQAGGERLAWAPAHRPYADWVSTGTVAAALAHPCLVETRTRACWTQLGLRTALAVGLAEGTKLLIRRERPDHTDRKSFFSEHTTLACVGGLSSKRQAAGLALCAATGYLRTAAKKHWLTDVVVGAGVGFGLSRLAVH